MLAKRKARTKKKKKKQKERKNLKNKSEMCIRDRLYGLLLDRMNLSMKNGWLDEENRVYIIYQIKDIMGDMNMARATAVKYLQELVDFGLVEKKKSCLLYTSRCV